MEAVQEVTMAELDAETVERLRSLPTGEILWTVRRLAFATGGGSEQYQDLLEEAVRQGLLTWDEVDLHETGQAR